MAVKVLRRMAATAPAPVFVARGGGAGLLPLELAADPRVTLVASPRHASVLLAAGRFPDAMGEALARVHDQLLPPRITVWWTADADAGRPAALPAASVVTGADPVDAVLSAHRNTVLGDAGAEDAVGADEPPNPFEGRGDYGQGGEGMMGGVPFGRPMAMTGDDRDGLALDRLTVTFGPFLPGFGNGLRLRAVLQGGVVQEAEVELLDLGAGPWLPGLDPDDHVRHDLRWLAEALRLGGLPALGCRSAMLARTGPGAPVLAGLARRVRRSGLPAAWAGIGVVDGEDARVRLERRLEFSAPAAAGPPPERVAEALVGQDWADAVVTLWSLDLGAERDASLAGTAT